MFYVVPFVIVIVITILIFRNYGIDNHKYSPEFLAHLPPVNYHLADASKQDVKYTLFFKSESDRITGIDVSDEDDIEAIDVSFNIDHNLPTKVFIHGYKTSPALSPWYDILRDEYFLNGSYNIIYVDWSKAANGSYFVAIANTKPIGQFIATSLLAKGYRPERLHIIGHSLGAHVAGFVGKYVFQNDSKKVSRITALDPSGPSFDNIFVAPKIKLHLDDALFVDIVHTDIGYYGHSTPLGHVDFYMNGGTNQPTCEDDDNCNHARSTHYFIDSVNNLECVAQKSTYFNGKIHINDEYESQIEPPVIFGEKVNRNIRGVYNVDMIETKPYPYLRENNEIK